MTSDEVRGLFTLSPMSVKDPEKTTERGSLCRVVVACGIGFLVKIATGSAGKGKVVPCDVRNGTVGVFHLAPSSAPHGTRPLTCLVEVMTSSLIRFRSIRRDPRRSAQRCNQSVHFRDAYS